MGSQPKPGSGGVSRTMIVVIIALLLVIIVPAAIMSLPLSKIVLTIRNQDSTYSADGHFSIYSADVETTFFYLGPGEERVWTFEVSSGTYYLSGYCIFSSEDSYYDYIGRSIQVGFMGTERVLIGLVESYW